MPCPSARRHLATFLFAGVLAAADAAPAAPGPKGQAKEGSAAADITAIAPVCAGPGDLARIEGRGFGGKNVAIHVGGVPAAVVSANGHEATFAVPGDAPQGPVEVVATNPGGQTGAVAWVVAAPGGCVLLDGPSGAPAVDFVTDLDSGETVGPGEVEVDPELGEVVRTEFEIWFVEGTTVAELNALLESIDARIVDMLAGVHAVIVRIPDPGSLAALDVLVTRLEQDPRVRSVNRATFPIENVLPPNLAEPPVITEYQQLRHQIAIRAPAAWNARSLQGALPLVIVQDYFGLGPPIAPNVFDVSILDSADFDLEKPTNDTHGYLVLSPIAAPYGETPFLSGVAAGTVPLRAINHVKFDLFDSKGQNRMLRIIREAAGPVVVNRSLGASSASPILSGFYNNLWAQHWIEKVRVAGLEDRFLLATSAGNIGQGANGDDASIDDWMNAAAILALDDFEGNPVPNLNNTLVVENRTNLFVPDPEAPPFVPGGLASNYAGKDFGGSKRGGQLSAIGSNIWAITLPGGTPAPGDNGGTSSASPQVAGLATYLWSIDSSLGAAALAQLLIETAEPMLDGAPLIDAYAAVLALDGAIAPGSARVREAILDVAGGAGSPGADGLFDEGDLMLYLEEFEARDGRFDWSRYDLNGNGSSGDHRLATPNFDRIDLDNSGAYGDVLHPIHNIQVVFDEGLASDLDVLCYYAYSPLYAGSELARADLLGLRCGAVPGLAVFQAGSSGREPLPASLMPGATLLLGVEVSLAAEDGSPLGLPDLEVRFRSDALADGSGLVIFTQPGGTVGTGISVPAGATELVVDVEVLGPDDPPDTAWFARTILASTRVAIPVDAGGPPALELSAHSASSAGGTARACWDRTLFRTTCDENHDGDSQTLHEAGGTGANGSTGAGLEGVSAAGAGSHGANSAASLSGEGATITASCNASASGSANTGATVPLGDGTVQNVFGGGSGSANGGAGGSVLVHEGTFLLQISGSGSAENEGGISRASYSVSGYCANVPEGCEVGPGRYSLSVECSVHAGAAVRGTSQSGTATASSLASATLTLTPR